PPIRCSVRGRRAGARADGWRDGLRHAELRRRRTGADERDGHRLAGARHRVGLLDRLDPGAHLRVRRQAEIDESEGTQTGRGMAVAGIVLGWVGIGMLVAALVLGVSVGVSYS